MLGAVAGYLLPFFALFVARPIEEALGIARAPSSEGFAFLVPGVFAFLVCLSIALVVGGKRRRGLLVASGSVLTGLLYAAIVYYNAGIDAPSPPSFLARAGGLWWAVFAGLGGYLLVRLRERYG